MMRKIKNTLLFSLILTLLLLIVGCQPKDKFEWNAGISAPIYYGASGPFVEYFYQGKSIAGASAGGIEPGWGLASGGYTGGDIYKSVPDSISVSWICDADGIQYKVGHKLPREKMLNLFKNKIVDSYGEKLSYSQIVAGFAPGGNVTVWMKGGGSGAEVTHFKTKNMGIWKENDKSYKKYVEEHEKVSGGFKIANIFRYFHGIPYSIWEKGDKQYKYDIGFSSEEDYKYSIIYYSKDGSVYFLDSTPYFLKWSNRFIGYPKNPDPSHLLKLPVQMDLIWHSYDKESRWFEGSVILPQNLQVTFEKGHYDRMIVTIPKDTGGDFVEGVIYLVNKQKQDQVMRFRLGRFNDEQKKTDVTEIHSSQRICSSQMGRQNPASKTYRYEILAGGVIIEDYS